MEQLKGYVLIQYRRATDMYMGNISPGIFGVTVGLGENLSFCKVRTAKSPVKTVLVLVKTQHDL